MQPSAPRLPSEMLTGCKSDDEHSLNRLLAQAGFTMRDDGRRQTLEPLHGELVPFVVAEPLQNEMGDLVDAAAQRLTQGPGVLQEGEAQRIIDSAFQRDHPVMLVEMSSLLHQTQRDLLFSPDPVPTLQRLLSQSERPLRLFRIQATARFHARDQLWRAITEALENGTSWRSYLRSGIGPPLDLTAGSIDPLRFFIGPLAARNQPLAAAFITFRGASIVAVPKTGMFLRHQHLGLWPVGGVGPGLGGSGVGMYATPQRQFPVGHAGALLQSLVVGTNEVAEALTDPWRWSDANREIEATERNIAWSTIQHGLAAVASIARDWASEETIWTAFRALTMFQGLWDPRGKTPDLTALLAPETIAGCVVSRLPNEAHRGWVEAIVENYKAELNRFAGSAEKGVQALREIRNLVHGSGFFPTDRGRRLASLRLLGNANIQFVRDVAATWWTGLVLLPHMRPRCPNPFAEAQP